MFFIVYVLEKKNNPALNPLKTGTWTCTPLLEKQMAMYMNAFIVKSAS